MKFDNLIFFTVHPGYQYLYFLSLVNGDCNLYGDRNLQAEHPRSKITLARD